MKSYASRLTEENGKRLMKKIQMKKKEEVEKASVVVLDDNSVFGNTNQNQTQDSSFFNQKDIEDANDYEYIKSKWISKYETNDKNPGLAFNFTNEDKDAKLFKSTLEDFSSMDKTNNKDTDKDKDSIVSSITNETNANDYNKRLNCYFNMIRFNEIISGDSITVHHYSKKSNDEENDIKVDVKPIKVYSRKNNIRDSSPLSIVQQVSCSYDGILSSEDNIPKDKGKKMKYRKTSEDKAAYCHPMEAEKEEDNEDMDNDEDDLDSIDDITVKSFNTDSIVDHEESFDELVLN